MLYTVSVLEVGEGRRHYISYYTNSFGKCDDSSDVFINSYSLYCKASSGKPY